MTPPTTVQLTRVGDRLALLLDGPMLDRLGIAADTPLQVQIDGDTLLISPLPPAADPVADAEVDASARKVMARYQETFRELAK